MFGYVNYPFMRVETDNISSNVLGLQHKLILGSAPRWEKADPSCCWDGHICHFDSYHPNKVMGVCVHQVIELKIVNTWRATA